MENQKVKHVTDVALFSGSKTLLVKYTDTNKYDLQSGWFIPDDLIQFAEHPEDAAVRILKEQLGIENIEPKLGFIESFTGGDKSWHLVFHYYINTDPDIKLTPVKDIEELKWFETANLPDKKDVAHHGWAIYTIGELLNKGKK